MHSDLAQAAVFSIGPLAITDTIITTWIIMLALFLVAAVSTRQLKTHPGRWQTVLEIIVSAMESAIQQVAGDQTRIVLPVIASLWIFLVCANLLGLIPGLSSPTANLSATSALALLVFVYSQYFAIRYIGLRRFFSHYIQPTPLLLPFHIVSEISRTAALAIRLFGNIMSLEMAALLVLVIAGFLVPVPILMLHIVEALVQAYIFGMLALIYIAGSIQSQQIRHPAQGDPHG